MQKRIAWVTGGTGGIGEEICRALATAGYQVVAGYSNEEKAKAWQQEQADKGFDIAISYADVADFDSVANSHAEIVEKYGPVSVLVNNAGITRDASLRRMELDQWQAVISTNLDSAFNTTKQCFDSMLEQSYGRIINISSINGEKGQMGQANYSAAKAGVHGFTMAIAQEGARKGVTANTISPGYIATEMIMAMKEEIRESVRKQIPVGRFGTPEDIARIVVFLADEKSGFITGANISANGGQFIH